MASGEGKGGRSAGVGRQMSAKATEPEEKEMNKNRKRERQQNETKWSEVCKQSVLYQTSYEGGWAALAARHRKKSPVVAIVSPGVPQL